MLPMLPAINLKQFLNIDTHSDNSLICKISAGSFFQIKEHKKESCLITFLVLYRQKQWQNNKLVPPTYDLLKLMFT